MPVSSRVFAKGLLVAAIGLVSATCSLDNPALDGKTSTLLTDAPFPYDRVERVDLFVVSVSASLTQDTAASSPASFVTLATPNRKINVLALQSGLFDVLGTETIPPGTIKAVRMIIDTDQSSITLKNGSVLTGSSTPGISWQSSAGKPLLNALIHYQIVVPETGATIVVDFDVGKAFIDPREVDPSSTDQGFIFSPVIRAAELGRTASISGTVRAQTSTGAAVANASLRLYLGNPNNAENTWSTIATARSDANGAFKFAYIPRSGFFTQPGVTYIVAVDPPTGSGLSRQLVMNVSTTAGQETTIGIVILP